MVLKNAFYVRCDKPDSIICPEEIFLRFIIIFLYVLVSLYGRELNDLKVVESTGMATVLGTLGEAENQAMLNALKKALNEACGTSVTGLNTLTDGRLLNSFIQLGSLGVVRRILRTRVDSVWNESDDAEKPLMIGVKSWYRFELECDQSAHFCGGSYG